MTLIPVDLMQHDEVIRSAQFRECIHTVLTITGILRDASVNLILLDVSNDNRIIILRWTKIIVSRINHMNIFNRYISI